MARKLFAFTEPIGGYLENKKLLRQEFDKLLRDPQRRDNIRKATGYIAFHTQSSGKAKTATKKKISSPRRASHRP